MGKKERLKEKYEKKPTCYGEFIGDSVLDCSYCEWSEFCKKDTNIDTHDDDSQMDILEV